MNKGVFGKTMGNLRNRLDVRLVKNSEVCQKLAIKPSFVFSIIFDKKFTKQNYYCHLINQIMLGLWVGLYCLTSIIVV